MDFELPEELAEVQKLAHDFADKEIAPSAAQDDREHRFRKDFVGKMGELGFYGCLIPEEFGAQRSGVPRPHADLGRNRAGPQRHPGLSQYAGRSRRDPLRVRQ
jgi:alkylation response protein AidB-like acyl-CoA dehydrogenase